VKKLERLKINTQILDHVTGIYRADTTGPDGYPLVAGVVCGADGQRKKVPVIMDWKMMTENREHWSGGKLDKIVKYKTYEPGEEDRSYIVGDDGDYGLQTLYHELMHVWDLVYVPSSNDELRADHDALFEATWKSLSEDKYGVVSKYGLTGSEPTVQQMLLECSKKHAVKHRMGVVSVGGVGGFGLADDDPFKRDMNDGELHEFLVDKTNFINQYASTNAVEDFAETFTIYFSGTRNNDWSKKTYYSFNESTGKRSTVFAFDAKKVTTSSKLHRKKACAYAKHVLGEDCDDTLK
jgi:hypothetical protein